MVFNNHGIDENDIVGEYSCIDDSPDGGYERTDGSLLIQDGGTVIVYSKGIRDQARIILERMKQARKNRPKELPSDDCYQLSDEEIETRNRLFRGVGIRRNPGSRFKKEV